MSLEHLVQKLVSERVPVRPIPRAGVRTLIWASSLTFFSMLFLYLAHPFALAPSLTAALSSWVFVSRVLLFITLVIFSSLAAFRAAVPGLPLSLLLRVIVGLDVMMLILGIFLIVQKEELHRLLQPYPYCAETVAVMAFVLTFTTTILVWKGMVLQKGYALGFCVTFGSFASALVMEPACVFSDRHALLLHLLPAVIGSGLAAIAGFFLMRPIRRKKDFSSIVPCRHN